MVTQTNLYGYDYAGADKATHIAASGWHGIGSQLTIDATYEEVAEKAGLDYEVEKRPLYFFPSKSGADQEQQEPILTDTRALVRADNEHYFGPCSKDWEPVQNITALQTFDRFKQAGDLEYVAGGTFDNGLRAWVMARAKRSLKLFDGQEHMQPHFLFCNTFRSGVAVLLSPQATVVSCLNQVEPVFKGHSRNSLRYRHVGPDQFSQSAAQLAIGQMVGDMEGFAQLADRLGKAKAARPQVERYWRTVLQIEDNANKDDAKAAERRRARNQKRINELFELAHTNQPNADVMAGTWWQYFQATTYHLDHVAGRSNETRQQSAWFGQSSIRKIEAAKLALEYANA